ncbi:non-ribosomal peptide synthetase, partial [Nonomuraea jiangxiensis]
IELGEIEAALGECPGVERVVATTVGGAARRLAAAVVTTGDLDPTDLRRRLAERLPPYMIPEQITELSSMPLSGNGKIDRAAVQALLSERQAERAEHVEPPRPGVESVVAGIWAELLELPAVGRDQNFFTLGGDSLLATRLITRLRAAGVAEAELTNLFDHPELADFAATVRLGEEHAAGQPALRADPDHRYEPFPPTDVQRAYWMGRTDDFALGGVGCHFYTEYDLAGLDLPRLEAAWNRLNERHEMLRAVFLPDGTQRILPEVPRFTIPVTEAGEGDDDRALAELRESMSHQLIDATRWPLFDMRAVRYGEDRTRLGVSFDNIILDALSTMTVLRELDALYRDPDAGLPPVGLSFRDYVLSVKPDPEALRRAQEYWSARVAELPPAPQLPLAKDPARIGRPRFVRRQVRIPTEQWQSVKDTAREYGLTPSTVLATAFAEALGAWSARRDMTINLTLFDRREVHPDIDQVLGDFTSLLLVAYEPGETWLDGARRLQRRVVRDLEHSDASALWVMRELARRSGSADVTMPVVFTSTLGVMGEDGGLTGTLFADPVWGVSQTPQVWLDHQLVEVEDGLLVNWDAVEELFPPGVLDGMVAAFAGLLERLSTQDDWDMPVPCLTPAEQFVTRVGANDTAAPLPEGTLHGRFFELARRDPARVAICPDVSYGELAERALRVAGFVRRSGVRPGEAVAVSLPKGPDQVAVVLGVLAAGALYVPIGVDQPKLRRERMLQRADVRLEITGLPDGPPLDAPVEVDPESSAYVIFTSGSTGEPKGVEVSHRAALNTVLEVNARFGVGEEDRVLAVSALDFDLSVWDVFGLLAAGGSLVMVDEQERRDAAAWARLVAEYRVTVWNSVPALLDMLLVVGQGRLGSLRLALVSGDWVPLDLSARLAAAAGGCRLVALGGATEAAIWSNFCPVPAVVPQEWVSVPYGRPLANQCFRVVDGLGRDCPDWVAGELWIGGAGVAKGYRGDPETTAAKFVEREGLRWYRTGDMGRYWPDGTLEFLGRVDHQVKVRGHRIELGEIEAALGECPGVERVVATTVGGAARRLAAAVVATGDLDDGDLRAWLADRLPSYAIPSTIAVLPSLPLNANGKVDRAAVARLAEEHDNGETQDAPPAGPVEETLAGIWQALLDVPRVGRHQNFVTLGGDSILATRLAEEIRIEFGVELPLRELFAGPTIAEHAALIEQQRDDEAFEEGAI